LCSDVNTIVIIILLQNKTATTLLKLCCQEHRCRMPASLHPANLHLNSPPSTQRTLQLQVARGKSFYDDQVIFFTLLVSLLLPQSHLKERMRCCTFPSFGYCASLATILQLPVIQKPFLPDATKSHMVYGCRVSKFENSKMCNRVRDRYEDEVAHTLAQPPQSSRCGR
jgi:hypothetical protein